MKYERLHARMKELGELYLETKEDRYLHEDYSILCLFESQGYKTYEKIADYAKSIGVTDIYDIGCAFAHQSEIFMEKGLGYTGVDNYGVTEFWNSDKYQYVSDTYPCPINPDKDTLGVSVLCLTWNCYLYEKEKTLREQCQALQKDFSHCLLYMSEDKVGVMSEYFTTVEQVDKKLYYFSNRN